MEWIVIFCIIIFIVYAVSKFKSPDINNSSYNDSKYSFPLKSWGEEQIYKIKEYHDTLADNSEMDFGVFEKVEIKGIFYRTKKAQKAASCLKIHDMVWIEPDPKNRYDKYAIKVSTNSEFIGFVDATEAPHICELIERHFTVNCFISDKIEIDIPYLYMDIYYSGRKLKLPEGENLTYEEAKTKAAKYQEKILHLRKQFNKYQKTADDKLLIGETKLADKAKNNAEIYRNEIIKIHSEYKKHCLIYQIQYDDTI